MDSKSAENQKVIKDMPFVNTEAVRTILLADVNSADNTFRITTRSDVDDLVAAIGKLGLMHPPVLKHTSSGYVIVCGFRRIAACRHLAWTQIPASVLKPNIAQLKMAELAVADNACQRPLNLIETSRALKLLADVLPQKEGLIKAAAALGLPLSPSIAPKIRKIGQLPWPIQAGILAGTINMSMALELGRFNAEIGEILLRLFEQLKVGLNRQRELLLLLEEIAHREDISIRKVIEEKPLNEILENTELDRSFKRQKIRVYLRQRRFPTISEAEAAYDTLVKQLKLGKDINLMPPEDFEGTTFTMTFRFDNREALNKHKESLEKIIHHPSLAKILD
jgi:ParB family chromosome partitioning protein